MYNLLDRGKIHFIYCPQIEDISDIKLIRTDLFYFGKMVIVAGFLKIAHTFNIIICTL